MRWTTRETSERRRCDRSRAALGCAALTLLSLTTLAGPAAAQGLTAEGSVLLRPGKNGVFGVPGELYRFGQALTSGDFNGDGHLDLAVAIPKMDLVFVESSGAVQVIYGGGEGLHGEALDDQLIGLGFLGMPGSRQADDRFGNGTMVSGDFDGDGYDDLAVASREDVVGGDADAGSLFVAHGSPGGLTPDGALYLPMTALPMPAAVEMVRTSPKWDILTVGDFDADGYDDLVVGHVASRVEGVDRAGAVTVLPGSPASLLPGMASTLYQGFGGMPQAPRKGAELGGSLAVGDFDGDGYDDLAIGAEEDWVGGSLEGTATVVHGSPAGLDPADSTIWARQPVDPVGLLAGAPSLAAGDFDADGYDDLVLGDWHERVGDVSGAGAVWIRHGGAHGFGRTVRIVPGSELVPLPPPLAEWRFGSSLAVADFDGDGRDDLAVSTHFIGVEGTTSILYSRGGGFDEAFSSRFDKESGNLPAELGDLVQFGLPLAAGDFDGNGATDLLVGLPSQPVAGQAQAGAVLVLPSQAPVPCQVAPDAHCLQNGRFRVTASLQPPGEAPRAARAVPALSDDSALFWFFDSGNWEVLAKVIDGCTVNSHFWLFSAATTNVAYTLRVEDTETGEISETFSPAGAAQSLADTSALAPCLPSLDPPRPPDPLPTGFSADTCPGDPTRLCLQGGRFELTVEWTTPDAMASGSGRVVPFGTADSGLFWFFQEQNWELLVKVLDGCPVNGRFWVFSAATTDVAYRLRVHDRVTKTDRVYLNPPGVLAKAATDTDAFGGCS